MMNKLISGFALSAVLLSNTTYSSGVTELCSAYKRLGEIVMSQRQKGKSIAEVAKLREEMKSGFAKVVMGRMIISAYELPIKETELEQILEVVNFGTEQYRVCLEAQTN